MVFLRSGLAAMLLAVCAPCGALDIKGIALGASPGDVQSSYSEPMGCGVIEEQVRTGELVGDKWCRKRAADYRDLKSDSYAGVPVTIRYTFHEARLSRIVVAGLTPSDYRGVLDALSEKFGPPDSLTHRAVTNLAGAELDNETAVWVDGKAIMTLTKYAGSSTETGLSIIDSDYSKAMDSRLADLRRRDM